MIQLVAGQNTPISADNSYKLQLNIENWSWGVIVSKTGMAPALFEAEQGVSMQDCNLLLNFHDINADIQKLTVYIAKEVNADNKSLSAELNDLLGGKCYANIDISAQIADQTALTLLDIYLHKGTWKIRCVLQGYATGLDKLLESFSIKSTAQSNQGSTHASIERIVDTANQPATNMSIQLHWSSGNNGKKSISNYFLGDKFKPISDLRIGCFYQLNNAQNGIVYSFDSEFKGSFEGVPYIKASRSSNEHLERLDINNRYQHKINRYLIFVTMMESFGNWNELNVKVSFDIPGVQFLDISPDSLKVKPIYAVAMLDFSEQSPKITPLNEYFDDLLELDKAFGWGLPFRNSGTDEDHCENNRDNED